MVRGSTLSTAQNYAGFSAGRVSYQAPAAAPPSEKRTAKAPAKEPHASSFRLAWSSPLQGAPAFGRVPGAQHQPIPEDSASLQSEFASLNEQLDAMVAKLPGSFNEQAFIEMHHRLEQVESKLRGTPEGPEMSPNMEGLTKKRKGLQELFQKLQLRAIHDPSFQFTEESRNSLSSRVKDLDKKIQKLSSKETIASLTDQAKQLSSEMAQMRAEAGPGLEGLDQEAYDELGWELFKVQSQLHAAKDAAPQEPSPAMQKLLSQAEHLETAMNDALLRIPTDMTFQANAEYQSHLKDLQEVKQEIGKLDRQEKTEKYKKEASFLRSKLAEMKRAADSQPGRPFDQHKYNRMTERLMNLESGIKGLENYGKVSPEMLRLDEKIKGIQESYMASPPEEWESIGKQLEKALNDKQKLFIKEEGSSLREEMREIQAQMKNLESSSLQNPETFRETHQYDRLEMRLHAIQDELRALKHSQPREPSPQMKALNQKIESLTEKLNDGISMRVLDPANAPSQDEIKELKAQLSKLFNDQTRQSVKEGTARLNAELKPLQDALKRKKEYFEAHPEKLNGIEQRKYNRLVDQIERIESEKGQLQESLPKEPSAAIRSLTQKIEDIKEEIDLRFESGPVDYEKDITPLIERMDKVYQRLEKQQTKEALAELTSREKDLEKQFSQMEASLGEAEPQRTLGQRSLDHLASKLANTRAQIDSLTPQPEKPVSPKEQELLDKAAALQERITEIINQSVFEPHKVNPNEKTFLMFEQEKVFHQLDELRAQEAEEQKAKEAEAQKAGERKAA